MKTKEARLFSLELGLILLLAGLGMAQAPAGPPKAGPEHQRLAYFAGKWDIDGDMKPSTFGPGGKLTYKQNCDWFEGNFAIVCHSEGTTPTGSIKGVSIMGWDPAAKTYTYFSTNSWGQGTFSRGTVEGDTWTWNNETKINGKPMVVRFTLKQVSPDVATYKFEMGAPGEPLKLMMDGKQTRVTLASN
jgi:hypothetical protein